MDSFGHNTVNIYEEMGRSGYKPKTVFLRNMDRAYRPVKGATVIPFDTFNVVHMVRSIYHIATSQYILVDNYFAFLSVVNFKEGVECIQLWHAVGAIKKFGLEDPTVSKRSKRAYNRFLKVYHQFHKIIVGSDIMADIFMDAFHVGPDNILKTGIPQTDVFFNPEYQSACVSRLLRDKPQLRGKKILLYAPTFRAQELRDFHLGIDIDLLQRELGDEFVLLLRLHPAVKSDVDYEKRYPGFVYDFSSYINTNELLFIVDCLITDYSSIVHDYSLLGRKMIFFPYDLEHYTGERGFWENYESSVPGPIVYTTQQLVESIKQPETDFAKIHAFARKWNQYSLGQSSKVVVEYLASGRVMQPPNYVFVPESTSSDSTWTLH